MKNISKHITFEEATRSQIAIRNKIDNIPDDATINRMEIVASVCFEPIREWYGKPLIISSFYRNEKVNNLLKGSKNSQHIKGEAIDIDTGNREENEKIFEWAKANLKYDQLINEYDYSWVHISFSLGSNRNQTLIIK